MIVKLNFPEFLLNLINIQSYIRIHDETIGLGLRRFLLLFPYATCFLKSKSWHTPANSQDIVHNTHGIEDIDNFVIVTIGPHEGFTLQKHNLQNMVDNS